MTVEFAAPRMLWLVTLLPLVWLAGRAGLRLRPRGWSWAARLLLLAALIGALAEPMLSLRATQTMLIYLVDASHSVSLRALDSAAKAIDATNANLRPDGWRILAFAGRVSAIADTAALGRLATGEGVDRLEPRIGPEATNLEQALAAARAEIPPSSNGRIVLFSDGRQTEGDVQRITERLSAERVPVFTHPMPVRDLGDTWIEDVRLPPVSAANGVIALDVVIGSQVAGAAEITVREGSRLLARQRAAVAVGQSTVAIEVSFPTPGPHLVDAMVTAERDVLPDNNTLSREVNVEPPPRLLYVHAAVDNAGVAPRALARSGFEVRLAQPGELPRRAEAYDRWDVVVLSNVARGALSTEAMAALASWVQERGGGLLFAGGNAVFGQGVEIAQSGYRHTEIERVLPVTFDRDDEPEVALVIVLDRSWSMNGAAMELSKTAAEAAANTLAPAQMLGVLTFNDTSNWDVPLARVRDSRPAVHDAIARITASGPTAIYPALDNAYGALAGIRARAKHVILLSDGRSDPQDFEGLVRKMSAAQITVSTVALGPEADVGLLRNLAAWGGGRNYVVQDAQQVPEIFVKEARNAATPASDETAAIPARVRQALTFLAAPADLPPMQGRNVVTRKPQAIEWLATPRGDPLLTTWPAGLGRTAMFAADLDGQWTREWIAWRGLGPFLDGIVRALAPRRLPPWSLNVSAGERLGPHAQLTVSLEARDADRRGGEAVPPTVTVSSPTADRGAIGLSAAGPGRYRSRVVADITDPLTLSVALPAPIASTVSRILVLDQAAEYRFGAPDEALLSSIARTTGGRFHPEDDDLRRAPRNPGKARYPLAPWLLVLALVLWPVDIALRRFLR